jgi:aspartyl-tRNA(Asn)/glutamyl-tRNA(Gln) amidotransferase subunit A
MLVEQDIRELVDDRSVRSSVSAVEFTSALLDRIDRRNGPLNAVWEVFEESAVAEASRVDKARAAGEPLPLDGLPMVIKDNIDVGGHVTSLGSGAGIAVHPTHDAESVARLRRAGAVLLGKAAMHELAFGATSDNPHRGPVRNPWSLDRTAGGSSSGSGAAVADDFCVAALGSDTGGSIRIPAALCGVSGLRPTYGTVAVAGLHPTSWNLDTIGPLARSASDLSALLTVLSGDHATTPASGMAGLRIGIAKGALFEDVEPGVAQAVHVALDVFKDAGAELVSIDIDGAEAARADCSTVMHVEALAEHETRLQAFPGAYGEAVRRRLDVGRTISATDYARALHSQAEWMQTVADIFRRVDMIATPSVPVVAPLIGSADMIASTAILVRLTHPWSFARVPAISIPCGFFNGLPVGVQLIARSSGDAQLLAAAAAYQSVTSHHRRRPPEMPELQHPQD